ncbi:MAG TPA: hypothetical protein VG939_08220 [Caulobacteraceae bacterium]|nr:hypothetical protein [Caulobacteraceae bacterium]
MRSIILAAALAVAGAAAAQPPANVTVAIGPELQAKASLYGQRDLDQLADELRHDVERALARSHQNVQLKLVLADAKPNRPTFKQLGDTPGLSMQSFGVGGATIEGVATRPDGSTEPVHYRWYESDIRQARHNSTWGDAGWTFQQFADNVAHGRFAER